MTVKELIEKLNQFPEDMVVWVLDSRGPYYLQSVETSVVHPSDEPRTQEEVGTTVVMID